MLLAFMNYPQTHKNNCDGDRIGGYKPTHLALLM